jgi:ComF family protein
MMLATPPIDGALCGNCIVKPKKFRIARSAMVYNQQSMAIIHRFKYDGKIQLAAPLGGLLLNTYLRYWPAEAIDLILPVPLHIKKFRRRGFNQSYLMIDGCKAIAAAKTWAVFHERLRTDVLIRNRATAPQTGLGRRQRLKNIKGVFSVRRPEVVKGRRALVVDDVYTTGATVNECAFMLLNAGAVQVDVLTLARAVQHPIDLKPIG